MSVSYSPPGKRPNFHALTSAAPAAGYLRIPAGAALIEALMRGILPQSRQKRRNRSGRSLERVAPRRARSDPDDNLRARRTNPASGLDDSRRRNARAVASRPDQLDREYDGGLKGRAARAIIASSYEATISVHQTCQPKCLRHSACSGAQIQILIGTESGNRIDLRHEPDDVIIDDYRRAATSRNIGRCRSSARAGRAAICSSVGPHSSMCESANPSCSKKIEVRRQRAVLLDYALGEPVRAARSFAKVAVDRPRPEAIHDRPAGLRRSGKDRVLDGKDEVTAWSESAVHLSPAARPDPRRSAEQGNCRRGQRPPGEAWRPLCPPRGRLSPRPPWRLGPGPAFSLIRPCRVPPPRLAAAPNGRTSRNRSRDPAL